MNAVTNLLLAIVAASVLYIAWVVYDAQPLHGERVMERIMGLEG